MCEKCFSLILGEKNQINSARPRGELLKALGGCALVLGWRERAGEGVLKKCPFILSTSKGTRKEAHTHASYVSVN